MGFLDRVKKAFDHGGIKTTVEAGKTFRWSDDVLPIDITIRNSADRPRTVNSIRLQLVEHDRNDPVTTRKVHGRHKGLNLFINEPATIAAGGEHTQHIKLPLSLRGTADELDIETPGWLDVLSTAINAVTDLNRDYEWYQLRVIPDVEGFTATKIATHQLRNLRAGDWGGGIFTARIGK